MRAGREREGSRSGQQRGSELVHVFSPSLAVLQIEKSATRQPDLRDEFAPLSVETGLTLHRAAFDRIGRQLLSGSPPVDLLLRFASAYAISLLHLGTQRIAL